MPNLPLLSKSVINPYAPPAEDGALGLMQEMETNLFFREGKFLVVRSGAELPHRCLRTNHPVGEDGWRKRVVITCIPSWIYLTLLAGILFTIIFIVIFQKKAKITYSLSPAIRRGMRHKRLLGWVLLLSSIGLFFAGLTMIENSEYISIAVISACVVLVIALVAFKVANPIVAVKHRSGWFRVKGCSSEFLDTLPTMPLSPF